MKSRDFCYWLQGFFELRNISTPKDKQLVHEEVEMIEKHLNLVFKHEIGPSMGNEEHQTKLNFLHGDTTARC